MKPRDILPSGANSRTPFRIVISATFTADPILPALEFWGKELNSVFEVRFAPYNQVSQTLLDPASEFAYNTHGLNVILLRLADLGGRDAERNVQELAGAARDAAARFAVPLLFVLCPPSDARLAQYIAAVLDDAPGVQFLSHEQIDRLYPVEGWANPEGERLGHIPYTDTYFAALATSMVRLAHALFMRPLKVIVLDCDNTLWRGICGEDGPRGVSLDPPHRALQEFMLEQRENGMLLCMASKNNEQDVLDTFRENPNMPLELRHFSAWRLNWQSKSENLISLAQDLNLGLDSLILVDDNPKECAEVEDSVPEVLTLSLPEDLSLLPHFLRHVWAFDHAVVTEEDRNRAVYYAQSEEFGRAVRQASDLEHFMATLGLDVRVRPMGPEQVGRVAQLTQRTNQFNLTTIRRTEGEIRALLDRDRYECFIVDVSDRFGDYGLAGVMIVSTADGALDTDTFLLSCRVLGRGVEHRMLAFLGALAAERGLRDVRLTLSRTPKNLPAQQFLEALSGDRISREEGFTLCMPAGQARAAVWTPAPPPEKPKIKRTAARTAPRHVDFHRIATVFSTPEQILSAIRGTRPSFSAGPMSATERRLADIWAELLGRASVALGDNFFDLGGHSLLAVLLVVRVKETFGIELPIDDVYSAGVTLRELAAKIDTYRLAGENPDDYAALLAEIESLSDEEVRRVLEQEDIAGAAG